MFADQIKISSHAFHWQKQRISMNWVSVHNQKNKIQKKDEKEYEFSSCHEYDSIAQESKIDPILYFRW